MDVSEPIVSHRAYRSLDLSDADDRLVEELAGAARLAPSCCNNQPWRFVFVRGPERLREVREVLSQGNEWAHRGSMVVAVCSRREDDCIIRDREYHLFDAGMAAAFLFLRATELGLVAHPIAGYSPKRVREALGIPDELVVVALVIVGRHARDLKPELSDAQREAEGRRPKRKPLGEIAYRDAWPA